MITSMSPQNSQMIWRHAPQGGVGDARVGDHGDARERSMPFGHRLEDRDALGANGQAVTGVLDVAAGDDGAVAGLDRRADLEAGEIGDRVFARGARRGDQPVPELHGVDGQSRPMMPSSSAMNCPLTCCAVSITSE